MRTQPTSPLRTAFRQDTFQDAPPPPCASRKKAKTGGKEQPAAPLPPDVASDLSDLFSTAISAVDFDAQDIEKSLAARRRKEEEPIEWRLVSAAAVLVILILSIDFIVRMI